MPKLLETIQHYLDQSNDTINKIIYRVPHLYLENETEIIENARWLRATFPPTEIVDLIRNSPSVLIAPKDVTYEKIQYIYKVGFFQK